MRTKALLNPLFLSLVCSVLCLVPLLADTVYRSELLSEDVAGTFYLRTSDLDQDGDLDAVALEDNRFIVLTNDGFGQFTVEELHSITSLWYEWQLECIDLDRDGYDDILLCEPAWNGDFWVWFNDGEGGFELAYESELLITGPVVPIDWNQDGLIDLAAGHRTLNQALILLQVDDHAFELDTLNLALNYRLLAAVDLYGNGTAELIACHQDQTVTPNRNILYRIVPTGSGGALEISFDEPILGNVNTLLSVDIDSDGDVDVISANEWDPGDPRIYEWWMNGGNGHLTYHQQPSQLRYGPKNLQSVDMDGDGDLDLVGAGFYPMDWSINFGVMAWWETVDGVPFSEIHTIQHFGAQYPTVAQINHDPALELITALPGDMMEPEFTIVLKPEESGFHRYQVPDVDQLGVLELSDPTLADLNDDGNRDLIAIEHIDSGNRVSVWMNETDFQFTRSVLVDSITIPSNLRCSDLDGDGDLDIVLVDRYQYPYFRICWYEQQDGVFTRHILLTSLEGFQNRGVVVGDLDDDGDDDILTGLDTQETIWFENDGSGNFELVVLPLDIKLITMVDVDGDGFLDLIGKEGHQHGVWFGDEELAFSVFSPSVDGNQHTFVASGDLTGDGRQEFIYNTFRELYIAQMNTPGSPMVVTQLTESMYPYYGISKSQLADFDGDGDLDILGIRNECAAWLENLGDLEFEPHVLVNDPLEVLVSADLNNDDLPDVVGVGGTLLSGITVLENQLEQVNVHPEVEANLPQQIQLNAAWPNPFNASTSFRFTLPNTVNSRISVYDVLGREVVRLHEGPMSAGTHTASWQGSNKAGRSVGSGIYFIRLVQGSQSHTRKVVLIK